MKIILTTASPRTIQNSGNAISELIKNSSRTGIRIDGGTLFVDGYECIDPAVVSYFADIESSQIEETFSNALKIGVAAFKVKGIIQPTEYIDRRFERIESALQQQIQDAIRMLEEDVERKFGQKGEISKYLEELLGKEGVVTDLLDSNNVNSPLYLMKQELRTSIIDLTTAVARQQGNEDMKERSPSKGFDFEHYVDETLGEILKLGKGDEYHSVSTQTGRVRNSKKGDRVIVLSESNDLRIAVEPKDVSKISLPEIHRVAEESMKNRDAQYAILIIKHAEALPAGVGLVNEYGNHFVLGLTSGDGELNLDVTRELLAMAYRIARIRVMEKTRPTTIDFDTRSLLDHLQRISASLDCVIKVDVHISNARDEVDSIQKICRTLKSDISAELASIEALCKNREENCESYSAKQLRKPESEVL